MTKLFYLTFSLCFFFQISAINGQKLSDVQIKSLIEEYKQNSRGPYKDIRWFCDDGTIIPPKESCPEPGGVQRARYKDAVVELGRTNHIFLGQILSTTDKSDFWDASNAHSRLKQYQLENYLKKIDDGWVNRKGQYYRGAYQIEDEITWGIDFLKNTLGNEENLQKDFFLIRQAAKDIPHHTDTDRSQRIRALSKVIADDYSDFMNLRIKIHGQPEMSDLEKVKEFYQLHESKLTDSNKELMQDLIKDMEAFYAPLDLDKLNDYLKKVSSSSEIHQTLNDFLESYKPELPIEAKIEGLAQSLFSIRKEISNVNSRTGRLALIDLSNALEEEYFRSINKWQPSTISEMSRKIYAAGEALTGAGFLELWEWDAMKNELKNPPAESDPVAMKNYLANTRRLVEWGAGMTRAIYYDVIELYRPFEPLAYGFIDDRVRSSILLDLGETVGRLGDMINKDKTQRNNILGINNASHAHGLNPGIALGDLVVLENATENMVVDKNKIYVFNRPPSDLKPVSGIATVTEGNMVSHVQLLARNLSIPNAVISDQNFSEIKSFHGKKVFYAVTSSGKVVMKTAESMSETEKALFDKKERNQNRVEVPVDRIDLQQNKVLDMRSVDAASSGVLCGPKAANLGQLKSMFPDQVVEGLVIPFGVFRSHMDQQMPGKSSSYWEFLNQKFAESEEMRKNGTSENEIEKFLLAQLQELHLAIQDIELSPEFVKDINEQFVEVFGKKIGEVPVFLRSDTNMEDLKEFTGAGLNLTLFNIVNSDEILKGIKRVWSSPYTERSFKWRQRYLLNPENVFPSILIIPSVDVDFSGVLITKGITSGDENDLTLAISRGAGGAVDGQAAESYLLEANGANHLLTPAREPGYRRLPVEGGTSSLMATFEKPIANADNLKVIRTLAENVERIFPQVTGIKDVNAYDIEFGFKDDKLWLFQIRPFVESKNTWETTIDNVTDEQAQNNEESNEGSSKTLWFIAGFIGLAMIGGLIWFINKKKEPVEE